MKTIQKDVEKITSSENIVTNVVEELFAFESFEKSIDWKEILYFTLAPVCIVQMRQIEGKLNTVNSPPQGHGCTPRNKDGHKIEIFFKKFFYIGRNFFHLWVADLKDRRSPL